MKKKDILIGAVANYNIKDVTNFVKSFRQYNKTAELVLIADRENFESINTFIKKFNGQCILFASAKHMNCKINNTRFYRYLEYLSNKKDLIRNVLLSDVADVYFQNDPFENTPSEFIYFFEEDDSESIGENSYNRGWIKFCYGKSMLKNLHNKTIICAGNTFGSYNNIMIYLNYMVDEISRLIQSNQKKLTKVFVDQGIQNYLAYNNLGIFKNPEIKTNGNIVATISITLRKSKEKLQIFDNYISVNNTKPAVVHQYNRSEELSKKINLLYSEAE